MSRFREEIWWSLHFERKVGFVIWRRLTGFCLRSGNFFHYVRIFNKSLFAKFDSDFRRLKRNFFDSREVKERYFFS